ncbi:MAG: Holliday junction branch migration protein RuvA [Eubacterium sp.]|nr:Holliday junction branch migration protein RuvA [Eubacterium sp.]
MIGYIKGIVDEIRESMLVLDHNGMGFQIFMPAGNLMNDLQTGDQVKVYTYLSVREDAMQLFGFLTKDDEEIFELLLGVSGIGPKGALGILSAMSADELRFAVLADDAGAISKAPGIGKKTAQKLILELKDKFALDDAFEKKLAHSTGTDHSSACEKGGSAEKDAIDALVALGYSSSEAMRAVRKADPDGSLDSESILKAALKFLF